MKNLTEQEMRELEGWARRAVHGLDESAAFVGICDDL
jgi:hypothetical protein